MEDEETAVLDAPETVEESAFYTQKDYAKDMEEFDDAPSPAGEQEETQAEEGEESPAGEDEGAGEESPSTINPGLASIAQRVGMSEDEVQAFGNDEALMQGISLLQNHSQANGEAETQSQDEQGAEGEGAAFEPFTVPDEVKEMLDEPMNQFFDSMNEHYQTQFTNALDHINGLNAQLQEMAFNQYDEWVSGQFDGLEGDLAETFGRGATGSLDRDSAQFKARLEVMERMEKLSVDPNLTREKNFAQSIDSLHAQSKVSAEKSKLSDQLKKASNGHTERPGQRTTQDNRSPHERAVAAVKAKIRAHGVET
jgi:hypothetical protein